MKFNIPQKWLASKAHLEEGKSIEAGRNPATMNLHERPTPETDRVERIIPSRLSPAEFDQQQGEWVPADHARRLERQRDAAVEALEKLDKQIAMFLWTSDDGTTRRDGTPEDCDAPEPFCREWSNTRATLAAIKGDKL